MKYAFGILLVIALFVLAPLAVIWSMNTLFPVLAIPYNIETWLAAILLAGTVRSVHFKK